jgi:hypothetical protein
MAPSSGSRLSSPRRTAWPGRRTELLRSHVQASAVPSPFTGGLRFVATSEQDERGELILALDLGR